MVDEFDWDKLFFAGLALVFALIAYALFVVAPMKAYTEAQCARRGWPGAKVTIGWERYCIRRVDQTDMIARLDTLR